jgi:hypothetical protein
MAEEKYEPRALLEFGSTTIILPTDKAVEAFKLLRCGEPVQYDWAASGYKRMKPQSRDGGVSLRTFSVTDYASLALNSVDE